MTANSKVEYEFNVRVVSENGERKIQFTFTESQAMKMLSDVSRGSAAPVAENVRTELLKSAQPNLASASPAPSSIVGTEKFAARLDPDNPHIKNVDLASQLPGIISSYRTNRDAIKQSQMSEEKKVKPGETDFDIESHRHKLLWMRSLTDDDLGEDDIPGFLLENERDQFKEKNMAESMTNTSSSLFARK